MDKGDPTWVFNLLQNIARYVFDSGKWFEPFHHMSANGPIRLDSDTKLTALAFILDPELKKIVTPHGEVQFIQIFGITGDEYEQIKGSMEMTEELIGVHSETNPLLITDLERGSEKGVIKSLFSKLGF